MSTLRVLKQKAKGSSGSLFPPQSRLEKEGAGQTEERIWQLQDEVRRLQEEMVRTRRALAQREVLLRNS